MLASNIAQGREILLKRLVRARAETDQLFGLVDPGSLYERPIAERHRLVFYLGHLEAFDWNLLNSRLSGPKPFDSELNRLFAFGIDPVDGALPSDQPADWPSLRSVHEYNLRIRSTIDEALAADDLQDRGGTERPETLLNVAIEHRLMHAETLSYMLHQLPIESLTGVQQPTSRIDTALHRDSVYIPGGKTLLGLSHQDDSEFGWDNEFERHEVEVAEFSIDRYKVTNAQYLEFVRAGGYQSCELWTEADWNWKEQGGIEHPLAWRYGGDGWKYRATFEIIPFPLDWPVYTSHAEARAYATWKGKRLPTEAEWHRAAYGAPGREDSKYPWGNQAPASEYGYLGMRRWDPVAVNAYPDATSKFGVEGMLCNGWEWTESVFTPFPGFQSYPCYPGYSASFFDGQHYVLKGSSQRTERCMLRRSFRNWFQPHYQYVYSGFRCVE